MKLRNLFQKIVVSLVAVLAVATTTRAEEKRSPVRIGFIGSLTDFAGAFGNAALDGVKIAVQDLAAAGTPVELFIEDDQSVPRNTVLAYQKLRSANKIDALITGTWWANSIVKTAEHDNIPFLSCETLFNKDFIEAPNYFSLLGDLRDWVRVYAPLTSSQGWKRAGMVKFVSGFADTLKEEMQNLFGKEGRTFIKAIEYANIEMKEAATIATQLNAMKVDVAYIDSQPVSFGTLMSRLIEQKSTLTIISNSSVHDAYVQKLFDPRKYSGKIFYSARETFQPGFVEKFERTYNRQPILDADLGYYATKLIYAAFQTGADPVTTLKAGKLTVDGIQFAFDEKNVFRGLKQDLFTFVDGKPLPVHIDLSE